MGRLLILFLLLIIVSEVWILLSQGILFNTNRISDTGMAKPAFVDVLDTSGIERQPHATGASWADYDNDGFLDLLLTGDSVRLYRNNGNGTFTEVTQKSGIVFSMPTTGGVFGDFDNDGCKDLFLVGFVQPDRVYHNNCDGTFIDVTNRSGIKKVSDHGYGAAWADYDSDGYLDLYLANYGYEKPNDIYIWEPNILYHNNRDGTFSDVTEKSGVSGVSSCYPFSKKGHPIFQVVGVFKESYQPIWFDYNNDGKVDLFIANDGSAISPLYRNNGDGTFIEVTKEAGLCREGHGMGITVGDYDRDGNLDIYITNTGVNYLWHNNGDGTFSEVGAKSQVADPRTLGWGTGFLDYDNDGWLDLYAVNGLVPVPQRGNYDPEIGKLKLDKLYKNNGNGTFTQVASEEGIFGDYSKEAAAFGDFNNDGFTDIYVATSWFTRDTRHHLYKNQGNKNHWITIELIGTKSNKDSIGARITLIADGKKQNSQVIAGSSFISQNSLWQTFGLGKAGMVDEIEIAWPSGVKKVLKNVNGNQRIAVFEERG